MKRRLTAFLCALAVCLSLLSGTAAADYVCFTAVNDSLCPLASDTMPAWVNGLLYVPATVFDRNETGVDLGMQYNYSKSSSTATLYNLRQMLVFDLAQGNSYDQISGKVMTDRAVNRNGRVYLPVTAVCRFFNLEYYYAKTEYGYLLRIRSSAAWLSDADFVDTASQPMSARLKEYEQSQTTSVPVTPPVQEEPKPPAVTEPVVDPVVPPETGGEEEPTARGQVYLAFRCETGEGLEVVLDALDAQGMRAAFFFDPELLAEQDGLVRRVVGSGHVIGLLADGDSAQQSAARLAQANQTLAHIACTAATAVYAPADQRDALERMDWVCWRESMSALPRSGERAAVYVQRILSALDGRRTAYLTLDDSAQTAGVLTALLRQLDRQGHTVVTPLETRM